MTVKYSGNRPGSINPITVKIDQTAAGQMNEGARMIANATFEGSSGTNKFKIETGGKITEFSVKVSAGDSNKDIQQKMADAINKAGISVKATVQTDSATNSSILKLESTNTGSDPKNSFTVTDITGNLAAKTGANDVTRQGQDAIYSVNGGPVRTSQSNTVNLGNGVSATFKKAFEEAVTISRGKNIDFAKSTVEDMARSYNKLYSEAAQRTGDPKSQNLASKMVSISKTYSGSLSSIGIGFDTNGLMTIDTSKMNEAAKSGKLEKFFTENSGNNYGLTNQLSRLSDSVSRNTSNYVSSSLFGSGSGGNFAYSNHGNLIQYNYLGSGSLFDYMF
jgi:flagellar hook-associated protein 2